MKNINDNGSSINIKKEVYPTLVIVVPICGGIIFTDLI